MNDRGVSGQDRERAAHAEARLAALFEAGEWRSERAWFTRRNDRNSFFTANILLLLDRCRLSNPLLLHQVDEARQHLSAYRIGHRVHHWPIVQGRSAMANAPGPWRARFLHVSPDADCTALALLAQRDAKTVDGVIADLEFYRADGRRFLLPEFQRSLPGAAGSFLTWFPEPERLHPGKLETIDAGADANILWYLAVHGRLATPGAAETIGFLAGAVRSGLLVSDAFRVSIYYPRPAVLLYLISRAAVWGPVEGLQALRGELLALLARCPAGSTIELLCRAATARLWQAPDPHGAALPVPDGRGAFYVGPLLGSPLQRWAALHGVAASPATQLAFCSEALEWALTLWLCQELPPGA